MQDGAPCRTAKKVQQWFDDHPWVTLLPWAPQSPDMNIIENLWTLLKQEVAKLPAATKQRGTEGKDFVSLEEPWKKT